MKLSQATVLVVDDEPHLRRGYALWLQRAGCPKIFTAANGLEAFEIFLTQTIDILVSDVRMPVLDGVGLLHRIGDSGKPLPIVIFVSGFTNLELAVAYSLGVEAFLPKPFSAAVLTETVSKSLLEREELWSTPLSEEPRAQVVVAPTHTDTPPREATPLRFGRGGFSCQLSAAVPLSPLKFSLAPQGTEAEIHGQGHVRWFSRETNRVGVEFHYLTPASRDAALAQVAARGTNSFIPL